MSIKNWIVTTERVKNKDYGLSEYASYLVSQKHQNHRETEIFPIFGNFNTFINSTIQQTLEFDKNNKKGGRKVESYAQSFNFILPPPHKPTLEQWKKISVDLMKVVHTEMKIKSNINEFGNACFLNLHDQKNPHLNMLIPRIFKNERLADLDRKNVLAKLKLQFNQSVLKHCQIDHEKHNPLRKNVGRRKTKQQYDYENSKKMVEKNEFQIEEIHKMKIEAKNLENKLIKIQKENDIETRNLAIKEKELIIKEEKINVFFRAYERFKKSLFGFVDSVKKDNVLDRMVYKTDLEEVSQEIAENQLISDEDAKLVEDIANISLDELKKTNDFEKPKIFSRLFKKKPC